MKLKNSEEKVVKPKKFNLNFRLYDSVANLDYLIKNMRTVLQVENY
jgi:hypothetical protein